MAHVELHGFPGLVFGIMILAAVPLYIATTVLTVRNGSVPVRVPLPKCFEPVPKKDDAPEQKPIVVERDILPVARPGVPAEMRDSFMRASKKYGARQNSVFNRLNTAESVVKVPDSVPVGDTPKKSYNSANISGDNANNAEIEMENSLLPLPDDFGPESTDDSKFDIPVFSDIDFGDSGDSDVDDVSDDAADEKSPLDDMCDFLTNAGVVAKSDGSLITTDEFAIAVHDDDDFWVTDDFDWFAAGRQKPSPIAALRAARENDGRKLILYLGRNNIMDFESMAQQWRDDGIEIITDRDALLRMIKNENQ